ncbi:MAG: HugZ family protein [Alphaproteobacteria bacterium]
MTTKPNPSDQDDAVLVRGLLRQARKAALGTLMPDGSPYVSLVEIAADMAGRPLLLLSDLAQHSQNLKQRPWASLLVEGSPGEGTALAGARVSLQGHIRSCGDALAQGRYLARHPHAADYAAMGDFHFYRFELVRAHLVAGFGRIAWIDADQVLIGGAVVEELAESEAGIVGHMNEDHADAIALYAAVLNGEPADTWSMTGIDPDGIDLTAGTRDSRVSFESPLTSASEARATLVSLVKPARAQRP